MEQDFNFEIKSGENISSLFLKNKITDFAKAMNFIRKLPYGRNNSKLDLRSLFTDNCGTCSTKHAILKELATENEHSEVKLMLCIFSMNKINMPAVSSVLNKHSLSYIPEAHNYLRINDEIADCTTVHSSGDNFINAIIKEVEIKPVQIADFKMNFHKAYLQEWLLQQPGFSMSLEEIWKIREDCIAALSN